MRTRKIKARMKEAQEEAGFLKGKANCEDIFEGPVDVYGTLDINGRILQSPVPAKKGPLAGLFEQAEKQGSSWFAVLFESQSAFLWMRKGYLEQLAPFAEALGAPGFAPNQAQEVFWMAFFWDIDGKPRLTIRQNEPEGSTVTRYIWRAINREDWVGWFTPYPDYLRDAITFLKSEKIRKYRLAFAVEWGPEEQEPE